MNITWRLSYSSVTPTMFRLGEIGIAKVKPSHHSDSELTLAQKHDFAEMIASFYRHRYHENSHPRRRFVMMNLLLLIRFVLFFLHCSYWASLTSTVSISVPGTLSTVTGIVLSCVFPILRNCISERGQYIIQEIFASEELWLAMLMLITVSRISVQFVYPRATVPLWPRIRPPTHQERTSTRLDARTDWRWKCGIFAASLLVTWVLQGRFLIAPVTFPHSTGDSTSGLPMELNILVFGLMMTGAVMQLILSYHTKVFAGQYKGAVLVGAVKVVLVHAKSMRWVVGQTELL
ncbi:hypothetical protein B0H19DRAFT_1383981 [Mycena capillaripes]|nr:hypothetical protein B0H19DRAFT_1383981 [Mycena capillaripes]